MKGRCTAILLRCSGRLGSCVGGHCTTVMSTVVTLVLPGDILHSELFFYNMDGLRLL